MSDLFGPLLGMSPCLGYVGSAAQADQFAAAAQQAYGIPMDLALNTLAPPLPEPGIHWKRTGGKSWRVVFVR